MYSLSNISLTFPVTSKNSSESSNFRHTLTLVPLTIPKFICWTSLESNESPTEKSK